MSCAPSVCTTMALLTLLLAGAWAETIPPGTVCEVTGDGVNLRTDSRITAPRVGKTFQGDQVVVRRHNMGWYQISPPASFEVWMHGKYVDRTSGQVQGDHVRLRGGPGTDHHILGKVHRTDCVEVMGQQGDWVRVRAPDRVLVWIFGKFLRPLPDAPAPGAAPATTPPAAQPVAGRVLEPQAQESPEVLEMLRRAEVLYEAAGSGGSREMADYTTCARLYQQIQSRAVTARVRHLVELRLGEIQVHQDYRESLDEVSRELAGRVEQLEQENQRLRQEYEEQVRELEAEIQRQQAEENEAVGYTATGWIWPMGRIIGRPGTHRLVVGGKTVYYLRSATVDLNADECWKRYVGVVGEVRVAEGWRAPVIDVQSLTVIGEGRAPHPSR